MKRSIINRLLNFRLTGFFILGLTLFYLGTARQAEAAPIAVSFQVFYDELMPYGDWVEDPNYGYIWIPYVDQNFQPYRTNGHWVMSGFGNTWVSNYDWGWAPFHYGRWFFSDFYGWAWIPGYEWGPAWVNWRTGRGYYGWYPLAPRVQFYTSLRLPIYAHWVFVPRRRLLSRNLYRYYMPNRNVNVIYNQTTVINNTYVYNNQNYIAGPSRSELQRVTRRNVPVYEVTNGRRPGRPTVEKRQVQMYRPEIRQTATQGRREANARPSRVINSDEYTRSRANTANSRARATNNAPREQSNRRSIRTETLNNSGIQNGRSARSGSYPAGFDNSNTRNRSTAGVNQPNSSNRNVNRGYNAPQGNREVRSNDQVTRRQVSPTQRQEINSNTPAQRRVAPAASPQRQVKSAPSNQRQMRSNSPAQRQVRQQAPAQRQVRKQTPAQRQVRQQAPAQRQEVRRSAPSNNSNRVRNQPSSRSNSSPRVSSGRTQTRSAAPARSQRSSSSSRSNARRGN